MRQQLRGAGEGGNEEKKEGAKTKLAEHASGNIRLMKALSGSEKKCTEPRKQEAACCNKPIDEHEGWTLRKTC